MKKRLLSGLLAICLSFSTLTVMPVSALAQTDWTEESAEIRQAFKLQNETGTSFENAPVLLHVDSTQIASQDSIRFYVKGSSEELPFEIENWNPNGISSVWVKIPSLKANADTTIWGYYNGDETSADSKTVWSNEFFLVEHFSDADFSKDSTGRASGTVTGSLTTETDEFGSAVVFTGNQKITYGALLSGENAFTMSAVINSGNPGSWVGIAGRDKNGGVKDGDAYFLGINGGANTFVGRVYDSSKKSYEVTAPFSQGNHILTLSYDGTTVKMYLDGVLKSSKGAAAGAVLSDFATPFVLGAYSDDSFVNGFNGSYREIQLSNKATSDDWEAFRYSNYFGSAVTASPIENKNGKITHTITAPADGTIVEAGMLTLNGYVSKPAKLLYSMNGGTQVEAKTVEAGAYELTIPLYALGEQAISITAQSIIDTSDSKAVSITLNVQDTVAPNQPTLSSSVEKNSATLSAIIDQAAEEKTSTTFYEQQTISLNAKNTTVLEGTTSASLPSALHPDAGSAADSLNPTTIGENETPYQIYQISLDESQQKAQGFQLQWTGSAEREVSAYIYDYEKSEWKLVGTGSGEDEFSINMDITNKNILKDGKISLLIWRGMNTPLSGRESYIPDQKDYDFNLMWTTDTQFYSENSAYTPLMTQQFQWVIDNFDTMKSKMFLNTGDLVNVANNREQWERINAAYKPIEAAGIPFSVINGNHDLQSGTAVNANYREFFPASRMAASNPYWGGTSGDNYYYLMEENGAKFILLGMGMKWTSTDIEWADNVLKTYSDHFAILMVHDYLTVAGDVELNSSYTNVKMLHDSLIAKNDNIGLVLCGHNHGANTNLEYFGNRPVYSILADYQSLPQGGLGYMRMLKFDVENNLIYVNTYSAYQDSTAYFKDKQTDKSGLYQINKDEFVIQTDFGGTTTRTLATSALKMMADTTVQIGETQQMVGPGTVSVRWDNLMAGETYTWFAILTDEAGNSTKTQPQSFATEAHIHSAVKAEGRDATCTKDGNIPYWYCEDCNQYFKDEALTETITKEQTVISATGHHNLVEDKGHAATCTEDGLTDGKHCTQCDYKVEQAVIPATGHTYKDGKCTECGAIDPDYKQPVEQSKPQSPQTGDNSNIILWISFMLAAGAGLTSAAGVYFRKRKQEG